MKKWLLCVLFVVFVQMNAGAFVYVDLDYTGRTAGQANDTFFAPNQFTSLPLGGPVGNQYIVKQARQFTVERRTVAHYLSVDALLVPWINPYETARSEYIRQRLAAGVSPEQIGLEINGDAAHPPTFVGPPQRITVNFALVEGNAEFRPGQNPVPSYLPSSDVLASTSYTFTTENSLYPTRYDDLELKLTPPSRKLNPDQEYWLVVTDPQFSGISFSYQPRLVGNIVNPEPSTLLLLGMGLLGIILRKWHNIG